MSSRSIRTQNAIRFRTRIRFRACAVSHRCSISMCRRPPHSAPSNRMRGPMVVRAAILVHPPDSTVRSHSLILRTKPISPTRVCARQRRDRSRRNSLFRDATHTSISKQSERDRASRYESQTLHRTVARSPQYSNTSSGRRVSWASRAINCCAMSTRKKSPPVSSECPRPQSEECMSSRVTAPQSDECEPIADSLHDRREPCDDRREPSKFTFDPCAIAAFARETAARESHRIVTRDCASHRLHASRESIGSAHNDDTANARAAHDSHDSRRHIITSSQRDSNYSSRLNFESSALRNRRLTRLLPRTPSTSPSSTYPPPIAICISSRPAEPTPRAAPTSHSISFVAVSANSITPPMDPRDATEVFSTAALGFVDFRAACEVLRSCESMDVFIRGLDAQFRRDIARSGYNSIRELLRARFARLPETLRALYEYAIVDCREAAPAMTVSSSGRREESTLCHLHVRSCSAALAMAEMIRREFATRPEHEAPQILIVAHEPSPHAETTAQPPTSADAPERAHAATAELPPSSSAPIHEEAAGFTPPDSGTASSSTPRPPIAPPRVFGSVLSLPPLSFVSPKTVAEAAIAAAALTAANAARRAEEAAQGVFSPRPFTASSTRPLAVLSSSSTATEPPPSGAPSPLSRRRPVRPFR